jgi:hypothetical protein
LFRLRRQATAGIKFTGLKNKKYSFLKSNTLSACSSTRIPDRMNQHHLNQKHKTHESFYNDRPAAGCSIFIECCAAQTMKEQTVEVGGTPKACKKNF